MKLTYRVAALLALTPTVAHAQESGEGPEFVPPEAVADSDKPDGIEWRIDATANTQFGDNRNVVGQTDGTSISIGFKTDGTFDIRDSGHEWRNLGRFAVGLAQNPGLDDLVKNRDQILYESTYLYHVVDWFGPFVRASAQTVLLQSYDVRAEATTYRVHGVDTPPTEDNVGDDAALARAPVSRTRFTLTDPFRPARFKQSLGAFLRALTKQPANLEFRAGVGAREVLADGQLALADIESDTVDAIEVKTLSNNYQVGGEGMLEFWGDLSEKKVTYRASVEALFPFAQSDLPPGDDRGFADLITVEANAALSFKLVEWASVDYELGVLREPLIIDKVQVRNNLLLSFGVGAGNVPKPE